MARPFCLVEAEGEVAVGEVDGGQPEEEDEVGDEVVLALLVFVPDDVHEGDDHEDSAHQLEEVQHPLRYTPFVPLRPALVDDEQDDGY